MCYRSFGSWFGPLHFGFCRDLMCYTFSLTPRPLLPPSLFGKMNSCKGEVKPGGVLLKLSNTPQSFTWNYLHSPLST